MTHQSLTTTVERGKIIAIDVDWPNGTIVRVEPMEEEMPTLWELMKDFDGIATDLPSDLAANIDHYVHGHPKK